MRGWVLTYVHYNYVLQNTAYLDRDGQLKIFYAFKIPKERDTQVKKRIIFVSSSQNSTSTDEDNTAK